MKIGRFEIKFNILPKTIKKDTCQHTFVMDTQITVVGCTKCKEKYIYDKTPQDIFKRN